MLDRTLHFDWPPETYDLHTFALRRIKGFLPFNLLLDAVVHFQVVCESLGRQVEILVYCLRVAFAAVGPLIDCVGTYDS